MHLFCGGEVGKTSVVTNLEEQPVQFATSQLGDFQSCMSSHIFLDKWGTVKKEFWYDKYSEFGVIMFLQYDLSSKQHVILLCRL